LVNAISMPVISSSLPSRHVILIPYPINIVWSVHVYYLYVDKFSYLFMIYKY